MIAIQNHRKENIVPSNRTETINPLGTIKELNQSSLPQLLVQHGIINHHPKAGINPIVDAAGYLFSLLGNIKQLFSYKHIGKLQKELLQEVSHFQDAIKTLNYNSEYVLVCRYILCATFDDIISSTNWGRLAGADAFSLLTALQQDPHHHDKFFNILERTLKEPALYIDLMELIYICLSFGYKGQYRATEHHHFQLEQITHQLYKHIRAYRGGFSKSLSPTPLKPGRGSSTQSMPDTHSSPLFILFVATCIVMIIFISLGYLMDLISNEAYKNISTTTAAHETH